MIAKRVWFLASILVVFSLFIEKEAKTSPLSDRNPPDSLRVRWMDGKKYILHKVEAKETLDGLSRRYQTTVSEIRKANIGIRELKIGQIINIPAKSTFSQPNKSKKPISPGTKVNIPIYYSVKHGETMYSISKKFNINIDELKSMNSLATHDLQKDQRLIVGFEKRDDVIVDTNFSHSEASATTMAEDKHDISTTTGNSSEVKNIEEPTIIVSEVKKNNNGKTLLEVTETGVATWIQDPQFGEDKFYALHRTAPIGTIIKVTNRMNGISVYVKVVGVLPDTGDNDRSIIKVSQSVSNKLNALDPLFQVELTYGILD